MPLQICAAMAFFCSRGNEMRIGLSRSDANEMRVEFFYIPVATMDAKRCGQVWKAVAAGAAT